MSLERRGELSCLRSVTLDGRFTMYEGAKEDDPGDDGEELLLEE